MNLLLSEQDYYHCELKSLIAMYDLDSLVMLYQPLIGSKACSLYMTYVSDAKYHEWVNINTFFQLEKKTNLNLLEIHESNRKLESLGLIKTYRKELDNSSASFVFEIYSPKTPDAFFKDPLFLGLLEAYIGEKEVSRIKRIYRLNNIDLKGYANISTTFKDIYNDVSFKFNSAKELFSSRNNLEIKTSFDKNKFITILNEKYGILKSKINEDLLNEIARLSLLFNYSEDVMASLVSKNYHPNEDTSFDFDDIYASCKNCLISPISKYKDEGYKVYDSDDIFAKKVNQLNDTAPIDYLRLLSNNTNPSPADINIINILSRDYGLSNGVINVIIDYTLHACNQDFPKSYCEKLASKLKRLKVSNALEAINALKKRKTKAKEINDNNDEIIKNNDEISDEDLNAMMENF